MSAEVGKDCESICGKCGDVWHVVVAKVGDQIVKVQCKQCGAYHRYRPPQKAKAAAGTTRRVAGAGGSSSRSSSPRESKPPPGPLVAADPLRPVKIYKPHFTFAIGDSIDHATFGRGVVELLPSPDRVQVWFSGERRTLVHARNSQGTTPASAAPALPERKRNVDSDE